MDFKKTRGGFRQQQNCVWFQHWIHGKLLYINVGKFVSGLPNLYQTGPNRVYIRPWRKHKFMHSVYTMWNVTQTSKDIFQLLCIMYIPVWDMLFTSLFIVRKTFIAFMTCDNMIFFSTDAMSFPLNNQHNEIFPFSALMHTARWQQGYFLVRATIPKISLFWGPGP